MIFRIISSFFLILCIVGILKASYKANKQYRQYSADAMLKSSTENSIFEKYIRSVTVLFATLILGTLLVSLVYETYNERLLFNLILGYLVMYYITHYLPHSNWVMIAEGFISKGNSRCIKWANINSYRWLKKNKHELLIIQYKGNGIITQRADFVITEKEKKQVKEILNEKVIGQQL